MVNRTLSAVTATIVDNYIPLSTVTAVWIIDIGVGTVGAEGAIAPPIFLLLS